MSEKITFGLKLTEEEVKLLDDASAKTGLSRAGFMRYHALKKAREVLENE